MIKKMTQKDILLNYLWKAQKENTYLKDQWIASYNIIKTNTPFGWLGTSADSLARKLRQDGLVESQDIEPYTYFRITDLGIEYLYEKQRFLGINVEQPVKETQGRLL